MAVATFTAALAWSAPTSGHPMPNTTVLVSAVPAGFDADVSIPLSELIAARGVTVGEGRGDEADLRRYVLDHAAVLGADGRAWPAEITRLEFDNVQRATLEVSLSFLAPSQAARRGAMLRYDAVTERIASHNVLIYLREPAAAGPRPLGRLQFPTTTVRLGAP